MLRFSVMSRPASSNWAVFTIAALLHVGLHPPEYLGEVQGLLAHIVLHYLYLGQILDPQMLAQFRAHVALRTLQPLERPLRVLPGTEDANVYLRVSEIRGHLHARD